MNQLPVTHIVGEVEFEIGEDGQLVASESVLSTILSDLRRGDIESASTLFLSAPDGTAQKLLDGALEYSSAFQEKLLEMFARSRDFKSAAICARRIKDPEKAAKFLESAYIFAEAAPLYEEAGKLERAALLYERALDYARAADLFLRTANHGRALTNLQRAGRHLEAGKLCLKMKKWTAAVEILAKAVEDPETGAEASWRLADLLERLGRNAEAIPLYLRITQEQEPSQKTLPVYYRLSRLLMAEGSAGEAGALVERALAALPGEPNLLKLRAKLRSAGADAQKTPPVRPPAEPRTRERPCVAVVDQVLPFLQGLSLFEQSTMEELKAIRDISIAYRVSAGTTILREGDAGKGLYLVARGEVEVVVGEGSSERRVAKLGRRSYFGEVSLVDDAPASATVRALTDAVLILVRKADFRDYLFANARAAANFYRTFAELLASRLRATNVMLASDG